jgi:hypothetical protein
MIIYAVMLIETQIGYAIREMDKEELWDAVRYAQQAMLETSREFKEPVAMYAVTRLQGTQIVFSMQTLGTHTIRDYVYNYVGREIFCFQVSYSHLDIHERFALGIKGQGL